MQAVSNTRPDVGGLAAWLTFHRPNPRSRLRLFCFPYAGGSALTYRDWTEHLPAGVEVCPIQHPGHGRRIMEKPFTRLTEMVESLTPLLRACLDKPFAFFGHSMGALVGFELARHVRSEYGLEPLHLFASGRRAPKLQSTDRITYNLPDEEFLEEVRRINKGASNVFDNAELMQLLLPHIRADFELVDTYSYAPGPPLSCPLTALGSAEDCETTRERLEPWREETAGPFSTQMLPGDHFYLESAPTPLFRTLTYELQRAVSALGGGS